MIENRHNKYSRAYLLPPEFSIALKRKNHHKFSWPCYILAVSSLQKMGCVMSPFILLWHGSIKRIPLSTKQIITDNKCTVNKKTANILGNLIGWEDNVLYSLSSSVSSFSFNQNLVTFFKNVFNF
jgi:hypothetical protein